jgi:hypothetical protein
MMTPAEEMLERMAKAGYASVHPNNPDAVEQDFRSNAIRLEEMGFIQAALRELVETYGGFHNADAFILGRAVLAIVELGLDE